MCEQLDRHIDYRNCSITEKMIDPDVKHLNYKSLSVSGKALRLIHSYFRISCFEVIGLTNCHKIPI